MAFTEFRYTDEDGLVTRTKAYHLGPVQENAFTRAMGAGGDNLHFSMSEWREWMNPPKKLLRKSLDSAALEAWRRRRASSSV